MVKGGLNDLTTRELRLKLPGLLIFECVAKHMNFARAADDLKVTPTAVSKSIKQLEAQMDVLLFNRNTRSVALTEAGKMLLTNLKPALEQIRFSLEAITLDAEKPAGLLRINSSYVAYATLIEPNLHKFLVKYPELTFEVSLDNSLANIIETGFDAGIRLGDAIQQDMISAPLGPIQTLVAVASPKYLKKYDTPAHPQDLLQHNCIRQRLSSHRPFLDWNFRINSRLVEIDVSGQMVVDEMRLAAVAAKNDMGVAYVFRQFVQREVELGELQIVLEKFGVQRGSFHIYYPNRRQMPGKLRVFIDHIRASNWSMPN